MFFDDAIEVGQEPDGLHCKSIPEQSADGYQLIQAF